MAQQRHYALHSGQQEPGRSTRNVWRLLQALMYSKTTSTLISFGAGDDILIDGRRGIIDAVPEYGKLSMPYVGI